MRVHTHSSFLAIYLSNHPSIHLSMLKTPNAHSYTTQSQLQPHSILLNSFLQQTASIIDNVLFSILNYTESNFRSASHISVKNRVLDLFTALLSLANSISSKYYFQKLLRLVLSHSHSFLFVFHCRDFSPFPQILFQYGFKSQNYIKNSVLLSRFLYSVPTRLLSIFSPTQSLCFLVYSSCLFSHQ